MFICDASSLLCVVCGIEGVFVETVFLGEDIVMLRLRGRINKYRTNSVINVAATNEK